jgi:hypothetical protein
MAVYLGRFCPKCRNYFGVVIGEPQGHAKSNPFTVAALHADTKSTGRSIRVMPRSAIDRIPLASKAGRIKVFGWKNIHKHDGASEWPQARA